MHHYVSSTTFLLGSGAELRGQMTREPLAWPLALVVDGKSLLSSKARLTNIQLISTAGIAPADLAHCLECARLPDTARFLSNLELGCQALALPY